jgi:hypothetical protein
MRPGCNRCFLCTEGIGGSDFFRCKTPPTATGWLASVGLEACGNAKPRDANGSCGIFIRSVVLALDPALRKLTSAVYINPDDGTDMNEDDAAKAAQQSKKGKKGKASKQ